MDKLLNNSTVIAESIDEHTLNKAIEGYTQRLAYWFEKAIKYDGSWRDRQDQMIYKEILQFLPNVTQGNLWTRKKNP